MAIAVTLGISLDAIESSVLFIVNAVNAVTCADWS